MDRNAPCPCGSGRKYKKCHGAPVPPEVAALPAEARAEWQRAELLLQRQKRAGQALLDWADRKLGPEWIDAALDTWGVKEDDDVDESLADLFTAWSLFNHTPATLGRPIAEAWLDDPAGRRTDDDTRAVVQAAVRLPLGLWEVETVEAGVGMTLTDRFTDVTCFVHEPDFSHDLGPSEFLLAQVLDVDGVRVFASMHPDTLVFIDGKALLADVLAEAGVTAPPLPDDLRRDAAWQLRTVKRFHETVVLQYPADDDEDMDGAAATDENPA